MSAANLVMHVGFCGEIKFKFNTNKIYKEIYKNKVYNYNSKMIDFECPFNVFSDITVVGLYNRKPILSSTGILD